MLSSVLSFLSGLVNLVPVVYKWITKNDVGTRTKKIDKSLSEVRDDIDEFKRTGRPPKK